MELEVGTMLEARKPGGNPRRQRWRAAKVIAPATRGADALVAVKFVGEVAIVKLRWVDLKTAHVRQRAFGGGAGAAPQGRIGGSPSVQAASAEVIDLDCDADARHATNEIPQRRVGVESAVRDGNEVSRGAKETELPSVSMETKRPETPEVRETVTLSCRNWLTGKSTNREFGNTSGAGWEKCTPNVPRLTADPTLVSPKPPRPMLPPAAPSPDTQDGMARRESLVVHLEEGDFVSEQNGYNCVGTAQAYSQVRPDVYPQRQFQTQIHDMDLPNVSGSGRQLSVGRQQAEPRLQNVSMRLPEQPFDPRGSEAMLSSGFWGSSGPLCFRRRSQQPPAVISDPTVFKSKRKPRSSLLKDNRVFKFAKAVGIHHGTDSQTIKPSGAAGNLSFKSPRARNNAMFEFTKSPSFEALNTTRVLSFEDSNGDSQNRSDLPPRIRKRARFVSSESGKVLHERASKCMGIQMPLHRRDSKSEHFRHPARGVADVRIPRAKEHSGVGRARPLARDELLPIEQYGIRHIVGQELRNYASPMRNHGVGHESLLLTSSGSSHRTHVSLEPLAPNFRGCKGFPFENDSDDSADETAAKIVARFQEGPIVPLFDQETSNGDSKATLPSVASQSQEVGRKMHYKEQKRGRKSHMRPSRWNAAVIDESLSAGPVDFTCAEENEEDHGVLVDETNPYVANSVAELEGPQIIHCICESVLLQSGVSRGPMIRCAVCAIWFHLRCVRSDLGGGVEHDPLISNFVCISCAEYQSMSSSPSYVSSESDIRWYCPARAVVGPTAAATVRSANDNWARSTKGKPRSPLRSDEIQAREENVELLRAGIENLMSVGIRERDGIDSYIENIRRRQGLP